MRQKIGELQINLLLWSEILLNSKLVIPYTEINLLLWSQILLNNKLVIPYTV
jgi:hypothetical protein